MEAIDYKCPGCGAKLPFNPDEQKWTCEYCGNSFTLEILEKYNKNEENEYEEIDVDVYECSNCGAKVVTDENTVATACVYCGNTAIMKNRIKGKFKPARIIPFKTNKNMAVSAFKYFKKGKLFAPKDFSKEKNIQKIAGVYVPFWIYDCDTYMKLKFNCKNIHTWRAGDYIYTKTDRYLVTREGSMFFDNVPVDGSKKFDDDVMDSIEPFDYKELVDFNSSYLSGFLAEKYDVEKEKAAIRARKRIENTAEATMRETVKGYGIVNLGSKDVEIDFKDLQYVLLPVWILTINYKDKLYTFAMNGQTGKMVGNIPRSFAKILTWGISAFAGFTALLSFVIWLARLFR